VRRVGSFSWARGGPTHTETITDFTEDQKAALATLTAAYPAVVTIEDEHDIGTCDSLVMSGHAVRVESDDFEGPGYRLSEAMAEVTRRAAQQLADEADQH
jgi:hypothetical protein